MGSTPPNRGDLDMTVSQASISTSGRAAEAAFEPGDAEALVVHLVGDWHLGAARPDPLDVQRALEEQPVKRLVFEASELGTWDTSLLTWVAKVQGLGRARNIEVDRTGLPSGVEQLIALSEAVPETSTVKESAPQSFVARVGLVTTRAARSTLDFLAFVGRVVPSLARFVTLRAQFRRSDLMQHISSAGAQALPIVTLVSVIVGLILAFVGSVQLRLFGADLYVANLVSIAMVREMGAIVVAIIMAGRTGAAFAAQLGTMKVTEETDALTTFGISTIDFLVMPRIVALCLMTPFLCLYSIVLGILGGSIVGVGLLGLSAELYFDQTLSALTLSDLYGGLFRGAVYGALVALTGCMRGMQCGTNAAAVGAATTSAVVTAIVAIVVADGVLAVLFNLLGI